MAPEPADVRTLDVSLDVDDLNIEQEAGENRGPVATLNDDNAVVPEPPRQSQRTTRPPLRMTYDALGQPPFQPQQLEYKTFHHHTHSRYRHPIWCLGRCSLCGSHNCFVYKYFPVQFQPITHVPLCN